MALIRGIAAALAIGVAGPAAGQGIEIDLPSIQPASWVMYQTLDRGKVFHVYRGKLGGEDWIIDETEGEDPNAPFTRRLYLDDRGNVLREEDASGAVTTYEPHDCARTIGDCTYMVTFPDGSEELRGRRTVPTTGGFETIHAAFDPDRTQREILDKALVSLDSRGAILVMEGLTAGGERLLLAQERAGYR